MTTLNIGDIVVVTIDSELTKSRDGGAYHWVWYESLKGYLCLRKYKGPPFVFDQKVKVEITPTGTLNQDFKCKVWKPADTPPEQEGSSPASKAEPVIDQGDLKKFTFSIPRGSELQFILAQKTKEWQITYGGGAEVARGRWLKKVLG